MKALILTLLIATLLVEWKDKHVTKNRIETGASQTCGDGSALLTAGVGKNSCGLSVRDVKDSGRATS
jgi:hypothetical protein